MAREKLYTAKQVAVNLLAKVEEILKKSEVLSKGETKHDRCVEHVKENSPEVKNPHAVCVAEGVKPSKWNKSEGLEKGETENSKKLGYKLSEEGKKEKQPEESDKAFEVEGKESKSSDDARLKEQESPEKNPKEQAEGNNEKAGTTPTQVGEDGKNKPGYDEMKGHLKLAKFIGYMDGKRASRKAANPQVSAEAQHAESIKDKK